MKRLILSFACLFVALTFTRPAGAATSAKTIVAAQLEAEGDRLGQDRAHLEEALFVYDRAVAIDEPTSALLVKRSRVRSLVGTYAGAVSDLTWALLQPDAIRGTIFGERCRAYRLAGDGRRALSDCRAALRLNVDDAFANGERAELELSAGNLASAWRFATTATEMDSQTTRYEEIRCAAAQRLQWPDGVNAACGRARRIGEKDR